MNLSSKITPLILATGISIGSTQASPPQALVQSTQARTHSTLNQQHHAQSQGHPQWHQPMDRSGILIQQQFAQQQQQFFQQQQQFLQQQRNSMMIEEAMKKRDTVPTPLGIQYLKSCTWILVANVAHGAMIQEVSPQGLSNAKQYLKKGDIILAVDEQTVTNAASAVRAIDYSTSNTQLTLKRGARIFTILLIKSPLHCR